MSRMLAQPLRFTLTAALIAGWAVWCACGGTCLPGMDHASHAAATTPNGNEQQTADDHDCCTTRPADEDGDHPDTPDAPVQPPVGDCPHCDGSLVNGWLADEPLHVQLNDHGPLTGYPLDRHAPLLIDTPSITLSPVDQAAMPPPRAGSLRDLSCLLQV